MASSVGHLPSLNSQGSESSLSSSSGASAVAAPRRWWVAFRSLSSLASLTSISKRAHSSKAASSESSSEDVGSSSEDDSKLSSESMAKRPRRSALMVVWVVVSRSVILLAVLLPVAFPYFRFGLAGYGNDVDEVDDDDMDVSSIQTCDGLVAQQYHKRQNPHWQAFGDTYKWRMVVACCSHLLVSILTCVGLGSRPGSRSASSAHARRVQMWLLLDWLVATLWSMDRACQWCAGGDYTSLQPLCQPLWNARQIAWVSSTTFLSWLVRMRVKIMEAAQGVYRHVFILSCLLCAQLVTLLVILFLLAYRLLYALDNEVISTVVESCSSLLAVLTVVVLLVALRAYLPPLRIARAVSRGAPGRRRDEARSTVRTATVHLMVTMAAAATSVAAMACDFYSHVIWAYRQGHANYIYEIVKTASFGLDLITNAVALLFLSGLLAPPGPPKRKNHRPPPARAPSGSIEWDKKVEDLAQRGISLAAILDFYSGLSVCMPHFNAERHTTTDVVREAIIPLTAATEFGPCSLATKVSRAQPALAQRMVTHVWSSKFADLIAAIVADVLELNTYEGVLPRLEPERLPYLLEELRQKGELETRYWVCAFSVNQHAGICGNSHKDPVTDVEYPACTCQHPKWWNTTPPLRNDGESINCEMNKFDDMMNFLAASNLCFRQLIAVDRGFVLFRRTWCVAEIYQGHSSSMQQVLIVHSQESLDAHSAELERLRVEDMQAFRPADTAMILAKIGDCADFNASLRWMILDETAGLLSDWRDAAAQSEALGRIARRGNMLT